MQGYICGIADNSRIDYCPICGEALGTNAYYGDGTAVCDECGSYETGCRYNEGFHLSAGEMGD